MADIRELGKKAKAKYPGSYDDLDDAELGRRVKAKYPGSYDDFTDDPAAPQSPAQKPVPNEQIRGMGDEMLDALAGVGAGAISTGVGAYNLARKIPVVGEMLPAPNQYVEDLTKPPDSLAGQAGKFAEQTAEFMLPMAKVGSITKALPLAGRVAAEAAAAGGIAGLQTGGEPVSMGLAAGTQGLFSGIAGKAPALSKSAEDLLKESAVRQYSNAMLRGGGKDDVKRTAEKVVPELIKRGETSLTLKGMAEKAGDNVREGGAAIGNAFDALPSTARIDVGAVENAIQSQADKMFRNILPSTGEMVLKGPEAAVGERYISRMLKSLRDHAEVDPATGDRFITAENARSLRQYYDKIAAKGGAYSGKSIADESKIAANEMAGNAMREELAKTFPDIAKLNKEYSFWKDVQYITEETLGRKTGHGEGLGQTLREGAGAIAGGVHGGPAGFAIGKAAAGTLGKITQSTAWKTVSAVMKDRLANALAKGRRGEAEHIINTMRATIVSSQAREAGNRKTEEKKD